MGSRAWCFTVNNWTDDDKLVLDMLAAEAKYMVYGEEKGESGTPHLQGYVELNKTARLSAMKKWHGSAHWEPRRGTAEQARQYCMKDGTVTERGNWEERGQGARTDLNELKAMLDAGATIEDVANADVKTYAKYQRFFDSWAKRAEFHTAGGFRKVNVEVHVGASGCGKTRQAYERFPNAFPVQFTGSFPFDGYDGHKEILIDEFYGQLKHSDMLSILDGHRYAVAVKGGTRYARWDTVIITSNKEPSEWYHFGLTPELARRINSVTIYERPPDAIDHVAALKERTKRVVTLCDKVGGNTGTPTSDAACVTPCLEAVEHVFDDDVLEALNGPSECDKLPAPTPQQDKPAAPVRTDNIEDGPVPIETDERDLMEHLHDLRRGHGGYGRYVLPRAIRITAAGIAARKGITARQAIRDAERELERRDKLRCAPKQAC